MVWAYGRQILFDSPQPGESDDWTYLNFLRDTFSHSTGLVDNRPQRRRWYSAPHPSQMPYQPLTDFAWEITETGAWAAGCFTNSYGRAGSMGNDSYPYKAGSNFYDGWGAPAGQFRQVAYIAPDIFVVQDWFVPNDTAGHTYEIRWQFNSTAVAVSGFRAQSTDSGQPNLAVIPLQTNDLTVAAVSAQLTPEVMGWRLVSGNIMPATTLRHARTGIGSRGFLTLLLPLRKGATADAVTFQDQSGVIALRIGDGREYSIHPAAGPGERLLVEDAGFSGDVLPVVRDAHIDGTSPASNFGAADVLAIGQTALGGHKAYLLFNASVLGARQAQRVAQLRVNWSASTSITRTLAFNLITGTNTATGKRANDWTETGLTWQNAPGNNVALSNREFAAFPGGKRHSTWHGTIRGRKSTRIESPHRREFRRRGGLTRGTEHGGSQINDRGELQQQPEHHRRNLLQGKGGWPLGGNAVARVGTGVAFVALERLCGRSTRAGTGRSARCKLHDHGFHQFDRLV